MNPERKIAKIEKIFNAAETAVQEITIDEEGNQTYEMAPEGWERLEIEEVKDGNVFDLTDLKKDFILAKRNLYTLIRKGQMLMNGIDDLDLEEMTGTKIMAIAQLSTSVAGQLKMLVEMYKDIADIEKMRRPDIPGVIHGAVQGDLNQNIVFAGDTSELMKYLKRG